MDNPKKKKLDRKRISLTQKHEVRYLKESTKSLLKRLQKFKDSEVLEIMRFNKLGDGTHHKIKQVLSIKRICKALLKYIEKASRKK